MPTRRTIAQGMAATLLGWAGPSRSKAASNPAGSASRPVWTAAPTSIRLKPGFEGTAELWTFNGELAPVLRIRHGAELRLTLKNGTAKPLSLHWHGVRGPNAMDGVGGLTQNPIVAGQSSEIGFMPPDAGTFLIRPCALGASAEPAARGLNGLLIVEETSPPAVDQDLPFLIADWALTDQGSLLPFDRPSSPSGRLGNWLSVNGKPVPERIEAKPGSRIRLRLANGCNARILRLRFDRLRPFVIAVDGQPTDTFEPLRASLPFPPGTRYDILLDMPAEEGTSGTVMALVGDGLPLVELVTAGAKAPAWPAMAPLHDNKKLPDAIKLQSAARADAVLAYEPSGETPWTINGKESSASRDPLLKIKRGTPVVLALENRTSFVQPFHLHGHAFRLLHPLDDGWEPYFLDTLQIPEKRTLRIAFIADNPGKWLLASTVLERFDAGLWTWFEVV